MFVLVGCGSGSKPKAAGNEPPPPATRRDVATGPVRIEGRNEKGDLLYVLSAPKAGLTVEGDRNAFGKLNDVSAVLYRDGKEASTAKADAAEVDKTNRKLVLTGGVRLNVKMDGATMTADKMVYREGEGRIEATGEVWVTRGGLKTGPLPALWATPDLRRFATPGEWRP